MCQNAAVQRRAQEELDLHVGSQRLPTFEDRESLVYIEALIKEVLRWAPVVPLSIPHRNTQEDEYEGMKIPKGSMIIANVWYDGASIKNHLT
jgi:cytochrome P450